MAAAPKGCDVARKNPIAEKLGKLLAAGREFEIEIRHRGAPDDRRTVTAAEVARVTSRAVVLADGTELPLHRVLAVRSGAE